MFSHKHLITKREHEHDIRYNTTIYFEGGESSVKNVLYYLLDYLGLELNVNRKIEIRKKKKGTK